MNIYKYLHPDRIDVLQNGFLRFSQPAALNDPFEIRPNLERVREDFANLRRMLSGPNSSATKEDLKLVDEAVSATFGRWNEDNASELGILSLSKNRNNNLMWAHYCDSHRGFVVGFELEHPFFLESSNGKGVLHEVRYSETRPILPAPSDPNAELFFRLNTNIRTKSAHWSYEHELRMCASTKAANEVRTDTSGQELYLFSFPVEIVKEIIFGFRIPSVRRRALEEIVRNKYPTALLFEMKLNEKSYDLDVEPYKSG